MYDTIIVHYPLPDVPEMPPEGVTLQTKEFDCRWEEYVLTEEGRVLLTRARGTILAEPIDIEYHGDIEAEGYTIRMTEGQVVWIKKRR